MSSWRIQKVQQLRSAGHSHREIARRMGVSAKAIRKLLRRCGWKESAPRQAEFSLASVPPGDPNLSVFCTAVQVSLGSHDTDPADRSADRLLARLGLLEDAAPLFGAASAVRGLVFY